MTWNECPCKCHDLPGGGFRGAHCTACEAHVATVAPATCAHERTESHDGGPTTWWAYRCADCKTPMCTDCGTAPVWWYTKASKCRRCKDKGGDPVYVELDVDAVLEAFGGDEEKTRAFIVATDRWTVR